MDKCINNSPVLSVFYQITSDKVKQRDNRKQRQMSPGHTCTIASRDLSSSVAVTQNVKLNGWTKNLPISHIVLKWILQFHTMCDIEGFSVEVRGPQAFNTILVCKTLPKIINVCIRIYRFSIRVLKVLTTKTILKHTRTHTHTRTGYNTKMLHLFIAQK